MKLLNFNLYDQLILVHGSKLDEPFIEIPNDWAPERDVIFSSTAILVDVNNLSEETISLVEIHHLLEDSNWKMLFTGDIKTEHDKLYIGDNEGVNHISMKTNNKVTHVAISYDIEDEVFKLGAKIS